MERQKMNSVEVCVAAMDSDFSLLDKMNIQSDCIVGNQCGHNEIVAFEHNGHQVKWLSFSERGVGLNRNNAWMRTTADVVLIADDDMSFYDGYPDIVLKLFNNNPKAI